MDPCLRNALCMVFLLGWLQATPVNNAVFTNLIRDIKCGPHVNFTSPTNVQDHCHAEALSVIKKELKVATMKCNCSHNRINQTLRALDKIEISSSQSNSSDCQWENEGSRKEFKHFVEDIQNLNAKIYITEYQARGNIPAQ